MGLYEMLLFTLCRISNNVNSVDKFCISINLVSLMDYILLSILLTIIFIITYSMWLTNHLLLYIINLDIIRFIDII